MFNRSRQPHLKSTQGEHCLSASHHQCQVLLHLRPHYVSQSELIWKSFSVDTELSKRVQKRAARWGSGQMRLHVVLNNKPACFMFFFLLTPSKQTTKPLSLIYCMYSNLLIGSEGGLPQRSMEKQQLYLQRKDSISIV